MGKAVAALGTAVAWVRQIISLDDLFLTIVLCVIVAAILGGFSAGEAVGRRFSEGTTPPPAGAAVEHPGPHPDGGAAEGGAAPTPPPPPAPGHYSPTFPPPAIASGKRYYIITREAAGETGLVYAGYPRVAAHLTRTLPGGYLGFPSWAQATRALLQRTPNTGGGPVRVICEVWAR